jgi:hypothetical protein
LIVEINVIVLEVDAIDLRAPVDARENPSDGESLCLVDSRWARIASNSLSKLLKALSAHVRKHAENLGPPVLIPTAKTNITESTRTAQPAQSLKDVGLGTTIH